MIKRRRTSERLRDRRILFVAMPLLSILSILVTVWAAITGHRRVHWLLGISIIFLIATGIFYKQVRNAIKTLPEYHAKRKKHTNGKSRRSRK